MERGNSGKTQSAIGAAEAAAYPEAKGGLFLLTAPPTIWSAHFLVSYLTAAIWCEKFTSPSGEAGPVQWLIGIYTLAALPTIGYFGWRGYRRSQRDEAEAELTTEADAERYRFLGFASLLLAGLSGVATIYTALVVVFVRTCH